MGRCVEGRKTPLRWLLNDVKQVFLCRVFRSAACLRIHLGGGNAARFLRERDES